jgi:rSAM/selenodomain-associated transferase 1
MSSAVRGRFTALFTKRPEAGCVKTRLCPPLAPAEAAALAEGMLADTLEKCLGGPFRTVLVHAPADAGAWFARRFPEVAERHPQVGSELGARLAHFARRAFSELGAKTLVLIGSDQPLVPRARLVEAHEALEAAHDVVLGPDRGGGYYLIGLRAPRDELFTSVRMSSAGMCAATESLARERGLTVARLSEDDDIDTPADLARLRVRLAQSSPEFTRHTRAALAELSPRLPSLHP